MTTNALRDSGPLHGVASSLDAAVAAPEQAIPSVEEIFQSHLKYVHRQLIRLGVRMESVDDAVQDVFMVVHKKLHSFDGKVAITTWLYAIALRVARRYRELQGKREFLDVRESVNAEGNPERDANTRFALEIAVRALDMLDHEKREVFVLSEIEQMSAPEIATIMGTPIPTVYSRLRLAKEAFATALRRLEARRVPR